jgi:hypothetical protein
MNDWSEDIEKVLDQIRINSVILSKQHKKRYFYLKNILLYFRLPVIIISGINSIVSVGLQSYLNQGTISMMTCLLALTCSIIGSIELYMAIQTSMENELMASKDYYILSIDIHKTLTLTNQHRPIPAKEYLDKKYNEYVKLYENSNLLSRKIIDSLNPLPEPHIQYTKNTSSRYTPSSTNDEESVASLIPQIPSAYDEESLLFLTNQKSPLSNKIEDKIDQIPQQKERDEEKTFVSEKEIAKQLSQIIDTQKEFVKPLIPPSPQSPIHKSIPNTISNLITNTLSNTIPKEVFSPKKLQEPGEDAERPLNIQISTLSSSTNSSAKNKKTASPTNKIE